MLKNFSGVMVGNVVIFQFPGVKCKLSAFFRTARCFRGYYTMDQQFACINL